MRRRPTKEQFQQQLERMAGELRREIIAGLYKTGDFLPSEKSLEARFRLSNHSIRHGLELLVQEGWIEKIPSVGNRVTADRPPVKLTLGCNSVTLRNLRLAELLEDFHQLYPWITIQINDQGGGIPGGFKAEEHAFEDDLIILDNVQFQELLERKAAHRALDSLPADDNRTYPKLQAMFQHEGELLMHPLVLSPLVLCYNKKHFREKGLAEPNGSWTWHDLIRSAELLSDGKGRYGFTFHIHSLYRWPLFLLQSGERFEWESQTKLRDIRGSRLLDSLKLCKQILHNRKAVPLFLSENNDDIDRMFIEGKLSMTLNTYMGLNGWNGAELEYDISPVPYIDHLRTLVISLGIGINSDSPHKEEAKRLVEYMVSERAQQQIWQHTQSIPALAALPLRFADKKEFTPERYMLFRETLGSICTLADLNVPIQAFGALTNLLKPYWANMIHEDELCERLEQALTHGHLR